jgi:phosphoribosylaminoimidazole-succinocarboxamide synthase
VPETLLYEGKAKRVFATDDEAVLLHRYKDDATAFNAQKRGSWKDKGKTNATMSAAMFAFLEENGRPEPLHRAGRRDDHKNQEAHDAPRRGRRPQHSGGLPLATC